jgi:hypothetical protein
MLALGVKLSFSELRASFRTSLTTSLDYEDGEERELSLPRSPEQGHRMGIFGK